MLLMLLMLLLLKLLLLLTGIGAINVCLYSTIVVVSIFFYLPLIKEKLWEILDYELLSSPRREF